MRLNGSLPHNPNHMGFQKDADANQKRRESLHIQEINKHHQREKVEEGAVREFKLRNFRPQHSFLLRFPNSSPTQLKEPASC